MRISLSPSLYMCHDRGPIPSRRRHSRFTSAWRRDNTESMSVLWNVLSCRAASFPIFRSTLSRPPRSRSLPSRTIVSYVLTVIPSRFITLTILSLYSCLDYIFSRMIYIFLSQCIRNKNSTSFRSAMLLCWIFWKNNANKLRFSDVICI